VILDESGLTWQRTAMGDGARGATFSEYRCVEHPRLTRLTQRANHDAELVETYSVEGIGNYYHSAVEALAAMEANP